MKNKTTIEQDFEAVVMILRNMNNPKLFEHPFHEDFIRDLHSRVASYYEIAKPLLIAMRSNEDE